MIKKLQSILVKREANLISYLKNNNDRLPLSMQHQLYSSIKEIENINNILKEIQAKVYKQK